MTLIDQSKILVADFYDILLAKYYGKTYYTVDWATEGYPDRSCKITWTEYNGKMYITDVKYLEKLL
jgi:hypothetical protein